MQAMDPAAKLRLLGGVRLLGLELSSSFLALLLRHSGATHNQEEREDEAAHRPP
jgi:hypothetical protein